MARFQSVASMVVNHKSYKAGTIFVDTVANKIAGSDIVWTGMSSSTMSPALIPLDASATTMKNGSPFATSPIPTITGRNSIDG